MAGGIGNPVFVKHPSGRNELSRAHGAAVAIPRFFGNRHQIWIKTEARGNGQKRHGVARRLHIYFPISRTDIFAKIGLFGDNSQNYRRSHAGLLPRASRVFISFFKRNSRRAAQAEQFRSDLGRAFFFILDYFLVDRFHAAGNFQNILFFHFLLFYPFLFQFLNLFEVGFFFGFVFQRVFLVLGDSFDGT